MKYLLALTLALCACGEIEEIKPNQLTQYIEWPGGSCMGKVKSVGITHSQLAHSSTQFTAECEDGRIVYNLSNFTVK